MSRFELRCPLSLRLCVLTWLENLRGQVVWIACGVGVLILCAVAVLSGAALSHQERLLDVSTYFFIDATLFLTALFMGSQVFPRDFSNRGLAEILVPGGFPKSLLFLSRMAGHATLLVALGLVLFLFRHAAFALADSSVAASIAVTPLMLILSALKLTLTLCVSAFFGIHTRPVVAMLGTLALFLFGHFSSGVSGLRGLADDPERLVSGELAFLFQFFRIWNPNFLVLESFQGVWESPPGSELALRVAWGASAIAFFALVGAVSVQMKDVSNLQANS
ncbi:MAG: hypothetical protein IOD12_01795 [Silvanigrellales bacterium]|nr:hypothetical protein [Silvanigrellales bacterium]